VFPETTEQRCWFHAGGNVLATLPKSAQAGAKVALAEVHNAEDREHAVKAAKAVFEKGILVGRPDESGGDQQVA